MTATTATERAYAAGYRAAEGELAQLASTDDGRARAARVLLGRLRFDDGDFDHGYRSCLADAVNGTTTDLSVVFVADDGVEERSVEPGREAIRLGAALIDAGLLAMDAEVQA